MTIVGAILPLIATVALGVAVALAAGPLGLSNLAFAQPAGTLKMMIPANPGGGWDQTGRQLAAAMQSAKLVQSVSFENKGGAAGTPGLAQFVNSAKGDPNAVMIGGLVMVGGIILNKSPVDLTMVTPIARLTSEYEVIVVPTASPHKTLDDLVKDPAASREPPMGGVQLRHLLIDLALHQASPPMVSRMT